MSNLVIDRAEEVHPAEHARHEAGAGRGRVQRDRRDRDGALDREAQDARGSSSSPLPAPCALRAHY